MVGLRTLAGWIARGRARYDVSAGGREMLSLDETLATRSNRRRDRRRKVFLTGLLSRFGVRLGTDSPVVVGQVDDPNGCWLWIDRGRGDDLPVNAVEDDLECADITLEGTLQKGFGQVIGQGTAIGGEPCQSRP
jgi:hypothetical protein